MGNSQEFRIFMESRLCSDDIYIKTASKEFFTDEHTMELTTKSIDVMLSIYNVEFAQQVRKELGELVKKHCYGCEVEHPSQTHHTCLMLTEQEHIDAYFEVALDTVDRKAVIDTWTAELKRMEGQYGTIFQINIDDSAKIKFVRLLENVE